MIEVLGILSSSQKQLTYERDVPGIPVTSELLSMWFDDTYLPDSKAFRECFSENELAMLAAFNEYYDQYSRRLPEAANGVADWLNDDAWRQIMQRASELLNKLQP